MYKGLLKKYHKRSYASLVYSPCTSPKDLGKLYASIVSGKLNVNSNHFIDIILKNPNCPDWVKQDYFAAVQENQSAGMAGRVMAKFLAFGSLYGSKPQSVLNAVRQKKP